MAGNCTIFDEPHYQSLEFLAAQALAEGNLATAFRFADRRCRILPMPESHSYVLRADASFRMGAKTNAIADLVTALEIAPDDIPANQRMLVWTTGLKQRQAASRLIRRRCNYETLRRSIQVLTENGQQNFANVIIYEDAIEGWAVWTDEAPLEVSISDRRSTLNTLLEPDPFHPLANYGCARSFSVRRPKSVDPQSILLSTLEHVFYATRTAGNASEPNIRVRWPRSAETRHRSVTVIVPIYGDYEATELCISSLLPQLSSSGHRAILVDDASPDQRISEYVAELAKNSSIQVLVNAHNLGFIGSVNRALERAKHSDVLILNSDTIVPPGFIDRLAAAAHSSPDIGTVTPLSNNGEFTSFPIPNKVNPLRTPADVARIDSIAAKTNFNKIVDIPTGIGFCLYITRACLEAVGSLCEDFTSGYLEDVDFCLRARERGFRSVCAPFVYVGHAGSKSFGQEKRSLVVRNLSVLEQRFPKHRRECAAFMAADPLRNSRQAIERAVPATTSHPILLLTGGGVVATIARERSRELASEAQPVMILQMQQQVAKIFNPTGGLPQSLEFNVLRSSDRVSLAEFVKNLHPSRIEILDPSNLPSPLLETLLKISKRYDLFIADGGLFGWKATQPCAAAALLGSDKHKCLEQRVDENWVERWLQIAEGAERIIVPCTQAEAYSKSILPQTAIAKIERCPIARVRVKRKRRPENVSNLGFVSLRSCAQEQRLMSNLARGLVRKRPELSITVIGATLDDIGLMRSSSAFVTGMVNADEFEDVVDALGVSFLVVCATHPLFGHPIQSVALSSPLPVAYFDWSAGHGKAKKKDLLLDPKWSADAIIDRLARWMPQL